MMKHDDIYYMKKAMAMARWGEGLDEVPVGCVIAGPEGNILSWGYNRRQTDQDPTGHAEMMAIRQAAEKLGSWRLEGCTLYVTLEPCPMCAGAIIQSRIGRVVYGASDPKGGCAGSCIDLFGVQGFNHYPQIQGGILREECAQMLKEYFKKKRRKKKEGKLC